MGLGGDDTVRGGRGADRLQGGPGADQLDGGPGRDVLSGGPGADIILARDGMADRIECGKGSDVVYTDKHDRAARDCERVRKFT